MSPMMDDKLSARELLLAFNRIQQEGKLRDGRYFLNTLCGEMGHDGYTVTISDDHVNATVGFHSSVAVNASSKQALRHFKEQVAALAAAAP